MWKRSYGGNNIIFSIKQASQQTSDQKFFDENEKTPFVLIRTLSANSKVITSAIGAEYSGPMTPGSANMGNIRIRGTHRIKSRSRERSMDCTGLPRDCRKMLMDLWIQHSRMVER